MAPAAALRASSEPLDSSGFLAARHDGNVEARTLPPYPQSELNLRQPVVADDWPLQPSGTIQPRDTTQIPNPAKPVNPSFDPMAGARTPESFNNKGYFALFAILGAVMVVAAIWFFFWADNGGFKWKKNDWDEYKSTVLRRKDKYGNTLSNATPRTDLGHKSVAGTFDNEKRDLEMGETTDGRSHRHHRRRKHSQRPRHEREPSDEDLRAYQHEKSAKVGGINRQADGSHYDFTNSDYSYSAYSLSAYDDAASNDSRTQLQPQPKSPKNVETAAKKKGYLEKKKEQRAQKSAEKKVVKDQKRVEKAARKEQKKGKGKPERTPAFKVTEAHRVRPAHRRPSFSTLDETSTVADNSHGGHDKSYYANYRPEQPTFARTYGNRSSPARASPRHTPAPREPRQSSPLKKEFTPRPPGSWEAYSDAGTSDSGTKAYEHHIPGISKSRATPSRSNGYRRGGGGRRDSLSDSD
ncbi:MAG: hypothetical protein Q9162_002000 [Coniocarpon cinnabarinum]